MLSRLPGRDWPTPVLTTAGKILRTVTPTTLPALVLIDTGAATTQTEIAAAINRDQSTISSHFQSLALETADVALIEHSDHGYRLTDTGSEILDRAVKTLQELGIELDTIDWTSATDKAQIKACLVPLSGSRSVAPFFLLDSVAARSAPGGHRSESQSAKVETVTRDVENRLQTMGKTTSNRQIRQIIDRFTDHNALRCEDDHLILTEKGLQHANLLHQVTEIVANRVVTEQSGTYASTDSVDEAVLRLRRDRISTSWSLENDDPQLIDHSHFYRQLKRIDFLDRPANEWNSFRWVTIENVGTNPTNAVVHKESGENKIRFEDMDPIAHLNDRDGQRLEINTLTDQQPSFEQKIEFLFPQPLPPGESLTIYYRLTWPNELAHYSSETQSISLTRYTHGVGDLQFGIVDKVDHVGVNCQQFIGEDDDLWDSVSNTPDYFAADERPELAPIHGEDYTGYLYTIRAPDYPGYRICYTPVE
ncbi:hypothetical protein SAMN05421858_4914 [Haladaptatus litoreus]|uniref:Uncharacterized protein n=2 Tax=Haladaptatus litoreus TaxID=553468 RepID=A0A1N7FBN8_9EURY|nr:hypothetical protein SAMN05421858_4914 [Haladaptatus litoreus]